MPADDYDLSPGLSQEDMAAAAEDVPKEDAFALVEGSFNFDPDVLNLKSGGKYVTGFLELPEGYSVREVFVPGVKLNGAVYAETCFGVQIFDTDRDGVEELMLKFAKADVKMTLSPGDEVIVRVTGTMNDGTPLCASDVITVIG